MSDSFRCPFCAGINVLGRQCADRSFTCTACGRVVGAPAGSAVAAGGKTLTLAVPQEQKEKREMPVLFPPPTRFLPQITRHIERTIGPSPMVFHEVVSNDIHLDLHVIPPQPGVRTRAFPCGRDFFTIVTSGLSTRPMSLPSSPDSGGRTPYAELMITLPASWPGLFADATMSPELMSEEENYWPIRWLKLLAHLAHEENVFLGAGNTYSEGRRLRTVAGNTRLAGVLAAPSVLHPKAGRLLINDDLEIAFLALWPLYPEELALARRVGGAALMERFQAAGVTDLVDVRRENVAPK